MVNFFARSVKSTLDPLVPDPIIANTLSSLFHRRVAESGAAPALWIKPHATASSAPRSYQALSWNDLATLVRKAAHALQQLGVRPGDGVAQVSENRLEWIVLDLAIHLVRGVHVAIHSVLSGPQIAWQINDVDAKVAFVADQQQLDKLVAARSEVPADLNVVVFDDAANFDNAAALRWSDLLSHADEAAGRQLEEQAVRETPPDDLATILYSSGTTGEPKGVMLTHGNLMSNAVGMVLPFDPDVADLRLSWLPLSHIFARTCDLYAWLVRGSQMALAESRETLLANCAEVRPSYLNGVPYFFDKVARSLQASGQADKPGKLAELFGGRIRICCSGGASLSDSTARFYAERGVLLVQGYGLTESSPVISMSTTTVHRLGTVGRPLAGVEVRIATDSEVLTRGPHVMPGYWKQPAATAAAIEDGWLHTGDLGELDADGFLKITGRKKELIVTSAGKNVAPTLIEGHLAHEPLIAQSMVIGEGRNYLTALIVPNPDALRAEIIARQIPVTSAAAALVHPHVHELYSARIHAALADLSHCEQIGRFTLLPRAFSMEQDELTPTLKLRRAIIAEHFSAEIERMYKVE